MNNHDIIKTFLPKQLDIRQLNSLQSTLRKSNIIVYGEIHGIKENSDVIYTLVMKLGVKRLAIEASPAVSNFINSVKTSSCDFSLVDEDLFDLSVLSLEMIKTIAILLQQNQLKELVFIDTFFDNLDENITVPPSPQEREEQLAKNILEIDDSLLTLCIMGQWHTQPNVIKNNETQHKSALYRLRKIKPSVPFVHNVYRQGQLFNDGKIIELPKNSSIPPYYEIVQKTDIDFELHIPKATKISLCKK
ncbi:hypothetical protein MBN60_03325 [Candidatus Saccharibacteria bacterium]|nr:hypothetical protein [Candidatus Saccharibacteria bacterium]